MSVCFEAFDVKKLGSPGCSLRFGFKAPDDGRLTPRMQA